MTYVSIGLKSISFDWTNQHYILSQSFMSLKLADILDHPCLLLGSPLLSMLHPSLLLFPNALLTAGHQGLQSPARSSHNSASICNAFKSHGNHLWLRCGQLHSLMPEGSWLYRISLGMWPSSMQETWWSHQCHRFLRFMRLWLWFI